MRRQDKKTHMEMVNIIFEERCLDEVGIPTLRTLTRKSKFGFGHRKDLTMQQLLDLNKKKDLISAYYNLTSINFMEDILQEIGIVDEWVIEKPGNDKELWKKFLEYSGYEKRNNSRFSGSNIMRKTSKTPSKSSMQSRNQGR